MEKFKLLMICLLIFNLSAFAQEFTFHKEVEKTSSQTTDSEASSNEIQSAETNVQMNAVQTSSTTYTKPNISSKKNAISVNGASAVLPRKYIYAEYERLLSSHLSIGIHAGFQSYHTDDYDGTNGGEWGGHKGFGVGSILRYYPQAIDELKGFYIGAGFDVLFSEWWWHTRYLDSNGRTDYTIDERGNSIAIAGAAQIGYKITIGEFFYIEPSVIGGFFGSISSDSEVESGPVLMPGLALGIRL